LGKYSVKHCAEYCGYQQAQMRIAVVAQKAEDFQRWLQDARKPAADPTNAMQARGRDVLLRGTCIMCHAIGGTDARGLVGPNLTHVASRQMLGAGAIPNRPGHLAGWIADAQRIKPSCRMPQNNIAPGDLRTLLEYVENLK
jgi:cytochrome c oxidase subunit 2